MSLTIVLVAALVLLVGLIRAEKGGRAGRILVFKAPLSLLFIVTWTLSPARNSQFADMILIALWLCLAGDVLLAFGSQRTFLLGLVSFLLGHAVYAAAFFTAGTSSGWMGMMVIGLLAAGLGIWQWLRPYLDGMQGPVLAYIVVISVMVSGAASLSGTAAIPMAARISIFSGAVLFYLSDICVARERFVVSAHINRLAGLPLYYAAQFLLAVSAGWVPASLITAS